MTVGEGSPVLLGLGDDVGLPVELWLGAGDGVPEGLWLVGVGCGDGDELAPGLWLAGPVGWAWPACLPR